MACGKGNANKPIEDFITHSPAPVDMAAKMSAIYTELSFKVSDFRFEMWRQMIQQFVNNWIKVHFCWLWFPLVKIDRSI